VRILLSIRLIQIKKELKGVGPVLILLLAALWFLIYNSYTYYQKTEEAFYITGSLFFLCFSLQVYRKDKSFVYNHIHHPYLEIYLEYVALTFLFAVPCLFSPNWFCYPVLLITLAFLPFLKYTLKQKTYFKNISSIIPASSFEWISGFRKYFLSLVPLYILALCICWFKVLPLLILWYITVTITAFYAEYEPLQILREGSLSSKAFLRKKLIKHSLYLVVLYVPIVLINAFLNSDFLVVDILFIPIQLCILCLAICYKYANYLPNKNAGGANMTLSLVSVGSIMPYFLPVPLIMAIDYYGKAKTNLDTFLHD
jgi:hypothetical protein